MRGNRSTRWGAGFSPRRGATTRVPSGILAIGAVFMLTVLAGCGYSLAGRGSYLAPSIKTVGIPLFQNRTSVFNIEQVLTERVRQEFIGRGKYTVTSEAANVDAVLSGEILAVEVTPTAFNEQQQATRYGFRLTTRLELRDVKANKVLWEDPSRVFTEEYDLTTSTTALDVNAFLGSDRAALDRVATDFARTTVSAILEAF